MKTTNEIVEQLRQLRIISDAVPLSCSQSIAVPGLSDGEPLLGFLFYPARGEAGKPKEIHPPVAKVTVDKRSGLVRDISFAPWIWRDGVNESTVLGRFPSTELSNLSLADADRLFQEYGEATDLLLSSSPTQGLQTSQHWSSWLQYFHKASEDGLLPYFSFEGFPVDEVMAVDSASKTVDYTGLVQQNSSEGSHSTEVNGRELIDAIKLFEQVRNFLRGTKQPPELLDAWSRARRLLDKITFSVAIVGEFSRGKSTLINDLIGEQLLPVGDLPTTATLTRVVHGAERSFTKIGRDGNRDTKALALDAELDEFRGGEDEAAHVFQVQIENDWLRESSLCLFDTPGVGDLNEERIQLLSESIANCDGTVIAVSALSPLSLTEQNFVEEHVFYHHVPNIALVITRLDQVPAKDRLAIIQFIVDKAKNWTAQAEIWIAREDDAELIAQVFHPVGTPAIRQRLSSWSQSSRRGRDRLNQIALQMLELVSLTHSSIESQYKLSQATAAEREESVRLAVQGVKTRKLQWDSLAIALERKSLSAETVIEEALNKEMKELEARLQAELTRCPKPHDWWQHELPFRLNQEFRSIATRLNKSINQRIDADCQWLDEYAKYAFNDTNRIAAGDVSAISLSLPSVTSHTPDDMSRYQNYGRVISGVVTAGGFVLFGPIAGGASILGGLVTDRIFKGKTEDQKRELEKLLQRGMEKARTDVIVSSREWIKNAYARLAEQTRTKGVAWQRTQLSAINREESPSSDFVSHLKTAEELSNKLRKLAGARS